MHGARVLCIVAIHFMLPLLHDAWCRCLDCGLRAFVQMTGAITTTVPGSTPQRLQDVSHFLLSVDVLVFFAVL